MAQFRLLKKYWMEINLLSLLWLETVHTLGAEWRTAFIGVEAYETKRRTWPAASV